MPNEKAKLDEIEKRKAEALKEHEGPKAKFVPENEEIPVESVSEAGVDVPGHPCPFFTMANAFLLRGVENELDCVKVPCLEGACPARYLCTGKK